MVEKLLRRHPHVFGESNARTVDQVWEQWDKIKKDEKKGTPRERVSSLDGIPKHLPSLSRAEKLVKKARKAGLVDSIPENPLRKNELGKKLFELAAYAQSKGWSAEELLRKELQARERQWRRKEKVPKS
jgi:uncharacterized protein YabN with tetrapyrrole methylase and pyrophosphatase domain